MGLWERGRADGDEGRGEFSPPWERIGRGEAMALGVMVCAALLALEVGLAMSVTTGKLADGVGLGPFAALCGRPGFAVMAGAAVYVCTLSQRRAAHSLLVELRAPVADHPAPTGTSEAAGALAAP